MKQSSQSTRARYPSKGLPGRFSRGCGLLAIALGFAVFQFPPLLQAECREGCEQTNTFLGEDALVSTTFGGFPNTAIGYHALYYDTTGYGNSALGNEALLHNTVGLFNAANGSGALYNNTGGSYNTASGAGALFSNTSGLYNTAGGFEALHGNSTGSDNTADGYRALYSNISGYSNTALGGQALYGNNSGGSNTAVGLNALFDNTVGNDNMAGGTSALSNNTEGNKNVALGTDALQNNTTGDSNIALGDSAGSLLTTGSNNIDIGNKGVAGESNKVRIGTKGTHTAAYIAGISGATVTGGVGVIVGSNGKLGTVVSSRRYKDEIKPMDKASEAVLDLQPVTFRYKPEFDPDGMPQFGLVAEDVAKINRHLVAFDEEGKPYTVRYEAVNAMLLNEFLKAHRKLERLEATVRKQENDFRATISRQQFTIDRLTAAVRVQEAQIEKVSQQLERPRPVSRIMAAND